MPFCPKRDGRDYTTYLSQRTLSKRATFKKMCQQCDKWMKRLDTHLRVSTHCRQVLDVDQPQSSPSNEVPQNEHEQLDHNDTITN